MAVLPDRHEWNTIPRGRGALGAFLHAILGPAQDVNLIRIVLIHIWNFPTNSPLPNWPLESPNGCYFDDGVFLSITTYCLIQFNVHFVGKEQPWVRQGRKETGVEEDD